MPTVPLQHARRQNLSAFVVDEVIKYIVANGLGEGDLLPGERQMCEQLMVSRTPLREGLRALHALGVIEVRHGKGVFVGRMDIRSVLHHLLPAPPRDEAVLLDLLEIRETLELAAVKLALPRLTEDHLNQLHSYIQAAQAKMAAGVAPVDEDLNFHEVFFTASQNSILASLAVALREPLRRARERYFERVGLDVRLVERHRAVYEAAARGDTESALALMGIHLQEASRAMAANLVLPPHNQGAAS